VVLDILMISKTRGNMTKTKDSSYLKLILLAAGILAIFLVRTLLAVHYPVPRLFDLFNSLVVLGAVLVVLRGYRALLWGDWLIAIGLGILVGVGMRFATLFSPYPFFDLVRDNSGQAVVRGVLTGITALGGLVIMRQGGPVPFHTANREWKQAGKGILVGLGIGLPLAVINVFALRSTAGHGIVWQDPFAAVMDALQPGIVEEIVYRFALWGLLWLLLRKSLPEKAVAWAGFLAMLVHNYAHFDDLFIQAPLVALGMGLVMMLIWGLPPYLLARRRGIESAVAFHWLQDAARFFAGF
jgi:hypothetical protein